MHLLLLGMIVLATMAYIYFFSAFSPRGKNDKSKAAPPVVDEKTKLVAIPGGVFHVFDRMRADDSHAWHLELSRTLGKFVTVPFGSTRFVFCYDYKVARKMLDDPQHQKWHEGYSFIDGIAGGDNLFSSEGFRSKHARKATNPAFHPRNVEHMMNVADSILKDWITEQERTNGGKSGSFVVDATDEMQRLTIDVIGEIGFGYKLSKKERELVLKNLQITYREYSVAVRKNPMRKLLPILYREARRARVASKELQALARQILDTTRSKESTNVDSTGNIKTILQFIVGNNDYKNDAERIRDMLVYVAGGYETTGATIGWTLYELARNPESQTWLRSELLKIKDPKERRYCQALKHVIRESIRLHLVASITSIRTLECDVPLPDIGGYMPAKSIVAVPGYTIHRDSRVFEKPDEFLPRRWEEPTSAMNQAWIGFGIGRRSCQGQSLANAELSVVLAKLCADYEWTVEEEGDEEYYVTLKRVGTLLRATKV